ncbi:MAG: 1-acyl-sn-glycerol-3-phosphate acyltransferase [Bacteroidales bacterium]|nr:1-acyl-sn-glycerol-3-phosphate acyltransferase [Bacteroidales bacterium]
MKSKTAAAILKAMGWTLVGDVVKEKNCVFLEAPHTSILDFFIGYLYYRAVGGHLRIMIKKEAFFFPVGNLLRSLGAVPIDRSHPQKTIVAIVHAMNDSDEPFHLAMCPEGTRKPVRKWKTGYHTIATASGAPVYVTFVDWGHKRVGIHGVFEITSDARSDTDRLQQVYESLDLIPLHPENYLTH